MIRLRHLEPGMRALLPRARGRMLDRPPVLLAAVELLGIVAIAGAVAFSVSSATANTSTSLNPVADTWVTSAAPSSANGSNHNLRVDGSPKMTAYLRFDLRSVSGTVTAASLQLFADSSSSAGISVHPVASTNWSEAGTTYATAPAMGSASSSSGPVASGQTVRVQVASMVAPGNLVSFGVTDNNGTEISFESREGAHPPVLVVTLGSVATVATVAPTSVPTVPPTAAPTTAPTAAPTDPTPPPTAAPTAAPTVAPSVEPSVGPTAAPTVAPTASPAPPAGGPTSTNPVRAAFYYPWFPESWTQNRVYPYTNYHPSAGSYDERSSTVVASQIKAMQYGKIQVGIASWWGQGSQTDAKIPTLLSTANGTGFKWALYFELEGTTNPSASSIARDLAYINSHYGSNPNLYKINGRPVVFVYGGPDDNCSTATRWAQANASKADYVVLKVFPGYGCARQPDQWHQYSPSVAEDHQAGRAFAIGPGFWQKGKAVRLARDPSRWVKTSRTWSPRANPGNSSPRSTNGERALPSSPRRSGQVPVATAATWTPSTTTSRRQLRTPVPPCLRPSAWASAWVSEPRLGSVSASVSALALAWKWEPGSATPLEWGLPRPSSSESSLALVWGTASDSASGKPPGSSSPGRRAAATECRAGPARYPSRSRPGRRRGREAGRCSGRPAAARSSPKSCPWPG